MRATAAIRGPGSVLMIRALAMAIDLGGRDAAHAERLYEVLRTPFVMDYARDTRLKAMLNLGYDLDFPRNCIEVLEELEPYVPRKRQVLEARVNCYRAGAHAQLERAQSDLGKYLAREKE